MTKKDHIFGQEKCIPQRKSWLPLFVDLKSIRSGLLRVSFVLVYQSVVHVVSCDLRCSWRYRDLMIAVIVFC